jgi:hypothetical protein
MKHVVNLVFHRKRDVIHKGGGDPRSDRDRIGFEFYTATETRKEAASIYAAYSVFLEQYKYNGKTGTCIFLSYWMI